MFAKLMQLIPRDWLVYAYQHLPFSKLKNWFVYKAQYRFILSVQGIITNDKGQVLLCKHAYRAEPWGMPGGYMELEQPEAALEREVYEETGLIVKVTEIARAIYGRNPRRVDLYLKGKITAGTFKPSLEITDVCFCDMKDWPEGTPESQKALIKMIMKK